MRGPIIGVVKKGKVVLDASFDSESPGDCNGQKNELTSPEAVGFNTQTGGCQKKEKPETFIIRQLKARRPIIENAPVDFNMAVASAFLYMSRVKVTVVSETLSKKDARGLGFNFVPNMEEAIELERKKRPSATVNILPCGGMTLPEFEEDSQSAGLSMFTN